MTQTKTQKIELILEAPPALGPSSDYALSERWKAYEINRVLTAEAGEGEYDCPACKNRGFIMGITGDTKIAHPCECLHIRKNWAAIRQSGMAELMERCSFENFKAEEPWQKTMRQGVWEWAEKAEGWLLLCGQSGSGKTHLASAAFRYLAAKKHRIRYFGWWEQAAVMKAIALEYDLREPKLNDFKNAEVLFIDDLLKCGKAGNMKITDADLRLAHELLEYRNIRGMTTILTTELLPDTLKALDEALLGRIVENCGKHIYTVNYNESRNYRIRSSA